ncbi:MAG TPA: ferritin-like domain-containing protein [Candidatus Binataceae bacterium]|nr:ferritin-like domain-containing protein [Candidatus Binataceae bacterium]
MSEFSLDTATQEPGLETAMKVVYQWNYDSEVEELRRLYVKAAEAQWIAERDLNWEQPIDDEMLSSTPLGIGFPLDKTSYWKSLKPETAWELKKRMAVFRLSNFLHGEQGALMVAAQLVNATPHTDAKFYAATQTMDEARHVEVFARYIEKLGQIRPIAPNLKHILDSTLETGDWLKKLVGMQIVVEGLALYSFRDMRNLTEEPLLKELLTYVARDESRHHAYGVQYVERCVPCLSKSQYQELQDFAFEAALGIIGSGSQAGFMTALLESWSETGIDTTELLSCAAREREELTKDERVGKRLGPVTGFVIPTLKRCGLLTEGLASRFYDVLRGNISLKRLGANVEEFLQKITDLPEDTAAWVLGQIE